MLLRTLSLILFSLLLAACGRFEPNRLDMVQYDFEPLRGDTGYGGYTISGNPEIYTELRDEFAGKSPVLARSIEKVLVKKLDEDQYQISVQLNGNYFGLEKLIFEGPLATVGEEKHALIKSPEVTPENYSSDFVLNIRCRSADCQLMEMRLFEKADGKNRAEAYWLFQKRKRETRYIESEDGGLTDVELSDKDTTSTQTSVVIIGGASYSQVQVDSKDAAPDEEPLVLVETDLVNTRTEAQEVRSVVVRGSKSVRATLQGNDPETGDLMFELQDEQGSGSVRVIVSGSTSNRSLQRLNTLPGDSIVSPEGLSGEIDAYTEALNAYADNPEVQKRIEMLLSNKPSTACYGCKELSLDLTTKVLSRMQFIEPQLREAARKTGTSPENAYLLGVESRFLKEDNFPIERGRGSSALGPWQVLDGIAEYVIDRLNLPYQVFKTWDPKTEVRYPINEKDDRRYVLESSVIGLGLFQTFRESIRKEPGMALLAYTLGPDGANKRLISRHGAYLNNGLSFNDLVMLNSFDESDVKADYVHSIIALRFIGMNPETYALNIRRSLPTPEKLRGLLKNPERNR